MAIVATVASSSANSYITLANADTYFDETTRNAVWDAYSDSTQKIPALLEAMAFIDALDWVGVRYTQTQALEWPRVGGSLKRWATATSSSAAVFDLRGRSWPVTAIPTPIQRAQAEMALAILQDNSWTSGGEEVETIRTGVVTLRLSDGRRRTFPRMVGQLLDGFIIASGAAVRILKA